MSGFTSEGRIAGNGAALAAAVALSLAAAVAPTALASKQNKPGPPAVSTGNATHPHGNSVELEGSVNPRSLATTYYFQWGPTVAYGSQTTSATLPAGGATVKVGQTVTGLLPGYHYRLVASNSDGTKPGRDRTYQTRATKAGFKLPKSLPATVYGGTLVVSGTLTGAGNAGQKVVLQTSPYPYHEAFANSGPPVTPSATGAFTFRVPDMKSGTQVRVSTLAARPLYSKTLTAAVALRVSLRVRTAKRRGLVRLYGTVTPVVSGARVSIQLLKPARPGHTEKTEERTTRYANQLSTPLKHATKSMSRYSIIADITQTGRYRAYVKLKGRDQPYVSGASQSVVLKAGPAPAKGKKKKK